jgi:hypothetical protein
MDTKKISKYIIEVRFKPDPTILDKRGKVASVLISNIFNHWSINNNRIDLTSEKYPGLLGFFSYRNLGIATSLPIDLKIIEEIAEDFIKNSWDYFPHDKITRIGIKTQTLNQVDSFTKTFNTFRQKFLRLDDDLLKKFDGNLVDLGMPLNFINGEDFFNVTTGPMNDEQSKDFFPDEVELYKNSLFVEVDYFKKEFSPHIIVKHVNELLKKGLKKGEEISDLMMEIIKQ